MSSVSSQLHQLKLSALRGFTPVFGPHCILSFLDWASVHIALCPFLTGYGSYRFRMKQKPLVSFPLRFLTRLVSSRFRTKQKVFFSFLSKKKKSSEVTEVQKEKKRKKKRKKKAVVYFPLSIFIYIFYNGPKLLRPNIP